MHQLVLAWHTQLPLSGCPDSVKPSHVQSPVFAAKFSPPRLTMRSSRSTCRSALTDKFSRRLNDHQTPTYCLPKLDGPCRRLFVVLRSSSHPIGGLCALWSCSLYGTHTRAGGCKSRELGVRRNRRRQAGFRQLALRSLSMSKLALLPLNADIGRMTSPKTWDSLLSTDCDPRKSSLISVRCRPTTNEAVLLAIRE
jgi:hypothetical protein